MHEVLLVKQAIFFLHNKEEKWNVTLFNHRQRWLVFFNEKNKERVHSWGSFVVRVILWNVENENLQSEKKN